MFRFVYILFLFISSFTDLSAQNHNDYNEMLREAENYLFTQPKESVKIVAHLIENAENSRTLIQSNLLAAGAYATMGDYNMAVKAIIAAKKLADDTNDPKMQVATGLVAIPLLNRLGMTLVAEEYYINIREQGNKIENGKTLFLAGGKAIIEAYKNSKQDKFGKSLSELKKANAIFQKTHNPLLINATEADIAEVYLRATNIDSAINYLQKTLQKTEGAYPNNFLKMIVYNQLGHLSFQKKNYKEAVADYQTALDISELLGNKKYSSEIRAGLATTYLALDSIPLFSSNRKASAALANEMEIEEDKAINSIYTYINDNQNIKRDQTKKVYQRNILVLGGILFFILLLWTLLKFRYKYRAKQYLNFINYFENKQKSKESNISKKASKSLNIPEETEKILVQKLNQFENSRQFTKQDMSLAMLAASFDTNTKYLSEIINTHKDKNFNSYINELRINYIVGKLKNNSTYLNYKISYLAEESGFSSHSSFATVFKAITGISPTVFIELLRSKKTTSKTLREEFEEAK